MRESKKRSIREVNDEISRLYKLLKTSKGKASRKRIRRNIKKLMREKVKKPK